MDSLEYEVLSYLEAGRSVFRPRDLSCEAQQSLAEVLGLLLRLRQQGYVQFADSRISRTTKGTYLALGSVNLTGAGRALSRRIDAGRNGLGGATIGSGGSTSSPVR